MHLTGRKSSRQFHSSVRMLKESNRVFFLLENTYFSHYTAPESHTMKNQSSKLHSTTQKTIKHIFNNLDYAALGSIYCDEGGVEFWKAHRRPCERMGVKLAQSLKDLLSPKGASLYVGAGVAEIPPLLMEISELDRNVAAYNLRKEEVDILNQTCHDFSLSFFPSDAKEAVGSYDHIWIVSVLNDPERFPELSSLSYGRANPVTFNAGEFEHERDAVLSMTNNCLNKLTIPGWITTSVEEIPWITNWCEQKSVPYTVGEKDHPTAIVRDPICFIHVG